MWVIYLFLKSKTLPHIKPSEIHLYFCDSDQRLNEFSFGFVVGYKAFWNVDTLHQQKQPSRGVLKKRCSENMQQIYTYADVWFQ